MDTSVTLDKESPIKWDDSQYYLPLPRHRRKIILSMISQLQFADCLDAGCAQHYLLEAITGQTQAKGYGCDLSAQIIAANQARLPHCDFAVVDIEQTTWPQQKQFELVICSEVIEHILNWQSAVKNLTAMSNRFLLITVPSGKLKKTDEIVGHHRHFHGDELIAEIERNGFHCTRVQRHGFPIHSSYKWLINSLQPDKLYRSFHSGKKYSFFKKCFAKILYGLFFVDYLFSSGNQLYILAERK